MSAAEILQQFPGLNPETFALTSPKTQTYNCIAYAAGDTKRWWWPDPDGMAFWPKKVTRLAILPVFQKAFESIGYTLGDGDGEADVTERIAIFSKGSDPSHASRQLVSGRWTSKFGREEDASHELREIEGGEYGKVAFLMHRHRRLIL